MWTMLKNMDKKPSLLKHKAFFRVKVYPSWLVPPKLYGNSDIFKSLEVTYWKNSYNSVAEEGHKTKCSYWLKDKVKP